MMERALDGGVTGKIKSVHCTDFVTYKRCSFHPTEYLNVIIGPNGTGKSTWVAAIVLGLGGEPKLLSRASSIQTYIRNGSSKAVIKVEIYAHENTKVIVFQRSFDHTGKSEFKVNDQAKSKNNFVQAVADYKIDISNLCQFLPQDRVQDFAKLNPQEIFKTTISSVCNQHVLDEFMKLKELRQRQLNIKNSRESNTRELIGFTARLEELKQKLRKYEVLKEYKSKLDVCNAKKIQLEIDQLKRLILEQKTDLKRAYDGLKERKRIHEEFLKKYNNVMESTNKLKDDVTNREHAAENLRVNFEANAKQIEELKKKMEEAETKLQEDKREWSSFQNNLENQEKLLEAGFQELHDIRAEIGVDSERVEQLRIIEQDLQKFKTEIVHHYKYHSDINKLLDDDCEPKILKLEREIDLATNIEKRKLQLLEKRYHDEHTALLWLQENTNLFTGKIYNPIMLELNVRDSKYAKYFENTIQDRDLRAFGCENKSDMSILSNELRVNRNLLINVIHVPAADKCKYISSVPFTNLKKFGFTSYLIDLVEGPPAILNYLCALYNLHKIPVGTQEVNQHTDNIPRSILQYYGGDQKYLISISKYSKEPSLMKSHVKGKELLSIFVDTNEVQALVRRRSELHKERDGLRNKRSRIEVEITEIEYKRNDIVAKKRAMETKIKKFEHLKAQLQESKCRIAKSKIKDIIPELELKFSRTVRSYLDKLLELENQKIEALQFYQKSMQRKHLAATKVYTYQQKNQDLVAAFEDTNEKKTQAQNIVDAISEALRNSKGKKQSKLAEAKNLNHSDNNLQSEVFNDLPNDLEELINHINICKARLECMNEVDQQVVLEHEKKTQDIEALKINISKDVNEEQNIEIEISSIAKEWYRNVCLIIDTLNKTFGNFMQFMSYVGEIVLIKKEDFDFDSYGIQINVQYRKNIALQTLDRNVQSGGERAVAIAVYTLSLQNIIHVPFCCVDEINQGMDARNERKVFELLVNETTQSNRAQYFFVTPKLLPNLKFNERVSVHVVFNGKMVQPENAFSFTM